MARSKGKYAIIKLPEELNIFSRDEAGKVLKEAAENNPGETMLMVRVLEALLSEKETVTKTKKVAL